jgi:replication factor C subunit 3/5
MTKNAQQALKYLLQTTTTNVRFCLICNYISKIDEPLKNEFISVRFNQLPQKDIIQFIETIIKKEDIKIAKNDIYTIQSMYKSDIRSMINFLQLNQNFKLNEWKKNILNPEVLDKLHNMFYTKLKQDDIINEIYNISRHYNIDKKHLIHCYLNHIVRLKLIPITENTIDIIKKTVHSVNADMEDVIIYLIESLKTIDFKPFPYVSVSSA